ncbi:MAG: hypothetical protein GIW99_07460 [Candidatus Eremiobacteraeota bacterium]|nr:hypothetical protein [Candidatus Eremiobacteraeota bacterium]MBC5827501.1 hypothetical protein [Candidatus Eremiobacteraeota bacterium]
MPLELLNTLASVGTFVVIATTAIAAVVQLHHMRGSNQIIALTELRETMESEGFREARRFIAANIPSLLDDERQHARLVQLPRPRELESISIVANFFENVGALVACGTGSARGADPNTCRFLILWRPH